jgi:hypothetical protein
MITDLTILNNQLEMILQRLPKTFISDLANYASQRTPEVNSKILNVLIMTNFALMKDVTENMKLDNVIFLKDFLKIDKSFIEKLEGIVANGTTHFKSICFFDYLKQTMSSADHNYIDNIRSNLTLMDLCVLLSETKTDIFKSSLINKKISRAFIANNKELNIYDKVMDLEICSKIYLSSLN